MPISLSFGANAFDTAPQTFTTVSLAGTSCSFGTYYQVRTIHTNEASLLMVT